jgi:serine/threonine-protein kinase
MTILDRVAPLDDSSRAGAAIRYFEASVAGEFALERELGRGGMGVVYLARDLRLGRAVAIKVLLGDVWAAPSERERFVREARTAASLSHPHVVPVYRIIEEGEFLAMVTAYIDGETLARRIQSRGPLDSSEAARILREVAWALGYAHARGVIHRDVKPENILLERGSGRAYLADFGVARNLEATSLTASGAILGTVHYMSPELVSGGPLDGRSDLYALGAMGYYAVTGIRPIDGPSAPSILLNQLNATPEPVLALNDGVSLTLAAAIERCLAKRPAERFDSAEAFAEAIAPVVGQRAEIPPLLRSWITRGELTLPVLVLWILPVAVMPNAELASLAGAGEGASLAQRLFALAAGSIPACTVALLSRLWDLRQMWRAGFTLKDIRFATHAYALQRSEELAAQHKHASAAMRFVRVATIGLAAIAGTAISYSLMTTRLHSTNFGTGAILSAVLAFSYATVTSGLWNRIRHYRSGMWNSRMGALLFRVASFSGTRGQR